MKLIIYRDEKKEWRWRAVARNGKIIGASSEGYQRKGKCLANWSLLNVSRFRIVEE